MFRIARIISAIYLLLAVVVTGLTIAVGPLPGGTAPLEEIREQMIGRDPVVIHIAYSTEKEDWLKAAAEQFQAESHRVRGRAIEIELEGIGSREMINQIIQGQLQPTVVSPASSVQIELLRGEWQGRGSGSILLEGDDAPQPLVVTPLVVVAWEERAQVLALSDSSRLWNNLHDVLADSQGWDAFGKPEWGLAKFGQTDPTQSNSGIQTLALLAYNYHNKTAGLTRQDMLDQGFRRWLDEIEQAVSDFPPGTSTLMENMVRFGPSKYDFVVVYENLAIENIETARGRWGPISIYYPPANMLSDHPYAILDAPWVSQEQREAAVAFREFLLSEEIQRLALIDYGFRPVNVSVAVDSADSPFRRFSSYGVRVDSGQAVEVEVPSADVLNELLSLWQGGGYN